jgi:hypothetical protein
VGGGGVGLLVGEGLGCVMMGRWRSSRLHVHAPYS